jgi:hypothetical protein
MRVLSAITRKWRSTCFGLRLLVLATIGVGIIVVALYLSRSKAVLYGFVEGGSPTGEPVFSVFNPFRDRDPERCAEAFLALLKAGRCKDAVSTLEDEQSYREYICEQEKDVPLSGWRLLNRSYEGAALKLYYWDWTPGIDVNGELWVTVDKRDGQWRVTDYERWY